MRKGKSVIGKPILSLADGTRLHEVKDVILGAGNDTVVGLLADEGGFLANSLVVPIEEVSAFGRDAVVVARRESVIAANQVPEIGSIVEAWARSAASMGDFSDPSTSGPVCIGGGTGVHFSQTHG